MQLTQVGSKMQLVYGGILELAGSLSGWQEESFTAGRWTKESHQHKVRVQWLNLTDGALAGGDTLVGTTYQVFERYGEDISSKDSRTGWLLLGVIDALQNEKKQLRVTGNGKPGVKARGCLWLRTKEVKQMG